MRIARIPRLILLAAPAALLLCAAAASAQVAALNPANIVIKPVPAGIVTFNAQLMAAVRPTVAAWVQTEAQALWARGGDPSGMPIIASNDVRARFVAQMPTNVDIESLVTLVMSECARDAQVDLEAILAEVKATTAARGTLTADQMARLQKAMDRKSQLEAVVSNGMKAGAVSATIGKLK